MHEQTHMQYAPSASLKCLESIWLISLFRFKDRQLSLEVFCFYLYVKQNVVFYTHLALEVLR